MATMYEIIMDLPLFKGVSKDHVSAFLEKTNLNFTNYAAGDKIIEAGEEVKMIRYVISGEVNTSYSLCKDVSEPESAITVNEICGHGRVFGADRLYGLSMEYPCDVTALTAVSVMEFSKSQYQRLLGSDPIYLINFFNYISRRAQRPVDAFTSNFHGSVGSILRYAVDILTDPAASRIIIEGNVLQLASYTGKSTDEVSQWIAEASKAGALTYAQGEIKLASRGRFLSWRD